MGHHVDIITIYLRHRYYRAFPGPTSMLPTMCVLQKRGFEYMQRVATSCDALASHLVRAAQFNIGRAYYQGSGVRRSVSEAERLFMHLIPATSCLE